MRADRWVIAAVLILGAGVWMITAYCHGTAGLAFALPVSGSKVNIEITTMGWPVLVGVPLTVIGVILLVGTFAIAIVEQFKRPRVTLAVEKPAPSAPFPS